DRIRNYRKQGASLLIVSHDRSAIQAICDKALLLNAGKILKYGDPEETMDFYSAMLAEKDHLKIKQVVRADGKIQTVSGTGEASILSVQLRDKNGNANDRFNLGTELTLDVEVKVNTPIDRLVLGFLIKDKLGQPIYGINTHRLQQPLENLQAGEKITYRYHFNAMMGPGNYSISLSLSRVDSHLEKNYEWRDYALVFHIDNHHHEKFVGCCWLNAQLEIARDAQ
ncbi:MAG TPA: Wzt carbohydrate-binding domain-containing protein, partial [Pseudomonadales bacterium]|nr:Wzt carbohydrate-binding domain-containing protein [Pseudomonadales bacterium]